VWICFWNGSGDPVLGREGKLYIWKKNKVTPYNLAICFYYFKDMVYKKNQKTKFWKKSIYSVSFTVWVDVCFHIYLILHFFTLFWCSSSFSMNSKQAVTLHCGTLKIGRPAWTASSWLLRKAFELSVPEGVVGAQNSEKFEPEPLLFASWEVGGVWRARTGANTHLHACRGLSPGTGLWVQGLSCAEGWVRGLSEDRPGSHQQEQAPPLRPPRSPAPQPPAPRERRFCRSHFVQSSALWED
jgi:hypothetical protein